MTPSSRQSSQSNPYFDQARLYAIQSALCVRADELFKALGVSVVKTRKMFLGCCPIHGGSNPNGLNFYPDGESVPGYWKCNTKGCSNHFRKTVLGFVRGVLSRQIHGWEARSTRAETEKQKTVSWKETVDWCCKFLGQDLRTFKVNQGEMEKRRFAAEMAQFTRAPLVAEGGDRPLTRELIRKHLVLPSPYFLSRGYSKKVLDDYDVGEYPANVQDKPLSHRAVVPVYDNDHRYIVGFTGRSIHPKCPTCARFHSPEGQCPRSDDAHAWGRSAKWFNHNFNKDSSLYNFWHAKHHISESGVGVLVEGPGDVWRLEEANIHIGLGMFGVELSDEQQVLLEMSGAMDLIILTDTDLAGETAKEELKRRLSRSFRLHFPLLSSKDVGEMGVCQVEKEVGDVIQNLKTRYK